MQLLESVLILMVLAVVLLQASRRFGLPYPSLLALAGIGVAAAPFLPTIILQPNLALAIFVTPALFTAAYDTSPSDLRRHWVPLSFLAVAAVILTTISVGVIGHLYGGMGWAAALTLGAIVSPPDASAVNAVLNRFPLPRRTLLILEGESLLNDATALLLFGIAEAVAMHGKASIATTIGPLLLAIPGGALLGLALGQTFLFVARLTAGSLSASIVEISFTFGAWILGEKLHVSPILAVVVLAMTVARSAPKQEPPRDRVHSTALRGAMAFILSTLAFLLLGMQVLDAAQHLGTIPLRHAIVFGVEVFLITVAVRIVWVFVYRVTVERATWTSLDPLPPTKVSFLTAWCGIRGILTIATASALPGSFPGRPLIIFAAFSVVLGTLVVQGFTIGQLIRILQLDPDDTFRQEVEVARERLLHTGLSSIEAKDDRAARNLRMELESALRQVGRLDFSVQTSGLDKLRCSIVEAQRECLIRMRDHGEVPEDVFQSLQEELDWAALAAAPADDLMLEEI